MSKQKPGLAFAIIAQLLERRKAVLGGLSPEDAVKRVKISERVLGTVKYNLIVSAALLGLISSANIEVSRDEIRKRLRDYLNDPQLDIVNSIQTVLNFARGRSDYDAAVDLCKQHGLTVASTQDKSEEANSTISLYVKKNDGSGFKFS